MTTRNSGIRGNLEYVYRKRIKESGLEVNTICTMFLPISEQDLYIVIVDINYDNFTVTHKNLKNGKLETNMLSTFTAMPWRVINELYKSA